MQWHNAFVFDKEREEFHAYEVYMDPSDPAIDGNMRTENPKITVYGLDVADAILGLELLIEDLKRGHVFNSLEELDEKYEIK